MPSDPELVTVGRVGRPHGVDGSFFIDGPSDRPERFAGGATLYAGGVAGDPGQAAAATSTGHAVFIVTLFGAVVSAAALLALPRNATKLAPIRSDTGAALPAQ